MQSTVMYFRNLGLISELDCLLELVQSLDGIKQPKIYHPEIDTLQHTLQVFDIARSKTNDIDLILASLVHDIGKSISSNNHAELGVNLLASFSFINDKVLWLVGNHLRVAYYLSGEMKKKVKIEMLVNCQYFPILLELRKFDIEGRDPTINLFFHKERIKKYLYLLITNGGLKGASAIQALPKGTELA